MNQMSDSFADCNMQIRRPGVHDKVNCPCSWRGKLMTKPSSSTLLSVLQLHWLVQSDRLFGINLHNTSWCTMCDQSQCYGAYQVSCWPRSWLDTITYYCKMFQCEWLPNHNSKVMIHCALHNQQFTNHITQSPPVQRIRIWCCLDWLLPSWSVHHHRFSSSSGSQRIVLIQRRPYANFRRGTRSWE